MNDGLEQCHCIRIAVFGKQRARVAKVLSLLSDLGYSGRLHDASTEGTSQVNVEFLACVATFGSYQGDDGNEIRYLAKAEYHGPDGKTLHGSSLAPFFDASEFTVLRNDEKDEGNRSREVGVSAVLIGCGIDADGDKRMVEKFIQTLTSSSSSNVVVKCVQPGSSYASMEEENGIFRHLHEDEKAEASRRGIMGPGKMALFVRDFVSGVIREKVENDDTRQAISENELLESVNEGGHKNEEHSLNPMQNDSSLLEVEVDDTKAILPSVDPEKIRFACRKCRFILFGEDDTMPHVKSSHSFTRQKRSSNTITKKECSSVFLSSGLDWMGDMSAFEGRLDCPKCSSKVGQWNWGGAQCSCGSWITPAIYFPLSKIDLKWPIQVDRSSTEDATVVHHSILHNKIPKEEGIDN